MTLHYKNVRSVDLYDFNSLVSETYKRPYDLQQQDGCMGRGTLNFEVPCHGDDFENDSLEEVINGEDMGVSFAAWLSADPDKDVGDREESWAKKLWWNRNFYPELGTLVQDLYKRGLIEKGEYQIDIDW